MSRINGKGRMLVAMLVAVVAGFVFIGQSGITAVHAEESSRAPALRGKPGGVIIQPMSIFDPNHQYLLGGTVSISASSGQVTINGTTTATQIVDSIGLTFYLQRWTGSSWTTVGSGNPYSDTNAISYSNAVNRSASSGYYHRARTIHWVTENSTYEQGELYTTSILVP